MSKPPSPTLPPKVEFYMHVGLCITAWAKVEEELFEICFDILGTTRDRAAIVFYRLPQLSIRLGLIDELTISVLPKRPKKDGGHDHTDVTAWKDLKGRLDALFGMRRRIAHQPVAYGTALRFRDTGEMAPFGEMHSLNKVAFETSYWIYLSQTEGLRGKEKPHLKISDLKDHHSEIERIAKEINRFRVSKLKTHLQLSARKAATPGSGTSQATVRLTIGRGPPPRSSPKKS
jgi:hypothetical protein